MDKIVRLTIEMLDKIKEIFVSEVRDIGRFPNTKYIDARVELIESVVAYAEDGKSRGAGTDFVLCLGVRVIAGDSIFASGYTGKVLSVNDFYSFGGVLRNTINIAYLLAMENAKSKAFYKKAWGRFGKSIMSTDLSPVPVVERVIKGRWARDPRTVSISETLEYVTHISGTAKYGNITRAIVDVEFSIERKIFASSTGSVIDQTYAFAGGSPYFFAQNGSDDPVDIYDHFGSQTGPEALLEGKNNFGINYESFVSGLSKDAENLSKAPPLKTSNKPVVVVTNPHFNALLVHEVIGHPAELDRGMKWETAYAGRSWFFHAPNRSVVDEQIASPLINVFADPGIDGAYGHYLFDDEGTPSERVTIINGGVFRQFLNSRQTAAMLGVKPNGHYLASSASSVPSVRMSVVAFAAGSSDPKDIIKEVEHGYYVVGSRIPAISESRDNFLISSRLIYEIRNGEIGQLFRDGSIMSDSKDFLWWIDAVGNDFNVFAIPNCAKGQPVQEKRVGNGGPTMRGLAYLVGK